MLPILLLAAALLAASPPAQAPTAASPRTCWIAESGLPAYCWRCCRWQTPDGVEHQFCYLMRCPLVR